MKVKAIQKQAGVAVAAAIITAWMALLLFNLQYEVNYLHPLTLVLVLLQTFLFTGLFITAHDAMHSTVSPNRSVNNAIGRLCLGLFMFNSWGKLHHGHHRHHRHSTREEDPDVHQRPFLIWYVKFLSGYITWWQFILAAALFTVLDIFFLRQNLLLFWVVPSLLSTLQLFYFGTYLPHRQPHLLEAPHHSRSQRRNHFLAFASCYFFGYHQEHHRWPGVPWWRLWQKKDKMEQQQGKHQDEVRHH